MRCRKVRSFLSIYSKGETSPEVAAEIKSHLDDCSSCRREENVYRSMNQLLSELPQKKASDDFTSALFAKIGQEGFAERKTKAYWPKRIPIFGMARLATAASVAVVVMALGIGFGYGDRILSPATPQLATTVSGVETGTDDYYLTVQPTDNPLLNEHKSVSRMIAQYNRWREYSKSLRVNAGAEQLMNGGSGLTLASSHSGSPNVIVRPVVKNYLIVP
jgi:hypothetical protein